MAQTAVATGRVEARRPPLNVATLVLVVSVALNLALAGFVLLRTVSMTSSSQASSAAGFNRTSYYAVFLNNKEAFVGHISEMNGSSIDMSDMYYLTFDPPKDAAGNPIANANPADYKPALKKLGQEVWGPRDAVQINRQNMEYYAELRPDSPIVKAIMAFQAPKK